MVDNFDEESMRTMRGDTADGLLGRIDQYDIIRKLGGGGFGVVYLVRDNISNAEYAIKTLHPLLKSNPEEMENLKSQFLLVSKLSHPNIASAMILHPVKDVVYATEEVRKELRLAAGDFMMVMRYAPGVTLSKWRKQFQNEIVPVDKAIDICKQIASALDYAHSEKIIHRDIKPGNIMVETCENGSIIARVLDFGLAAEIRSSMSRVSTDKGDTSGTRPYMAPEQWQGKKQGPATDQYALACLFYELVSGAVPFAGVFETGDFQIMINSVENRLPEALEELSEEQNQVLLKALSKSPKDRYDSCSIFLDVMLGKETVQPKANISSSNSNIKSIICKKCNFENSSHATFCSSCGAEIERDDVCLKCKSKLDLSQKFCDNCGAKTPIYIAELAKAERIAKEKAEVERKAREEAERKAREEAERKAREEAERKAREEAEQKVNEATKAEKSRRRKKKYIFGFLVLIIFSCIAISRMNSVDALATIDVPATVDDVAEINKLISDMVKIPDSAAHKGLYFDKYEVTQAQWQAIMGNNPSYFKGDLSRPVEQVSWDDCQEFIKKLNARTEVKSAGITFRLPTEEEWEYASRAGSKGKYGLLADGREGTLDEMGWYYDNSDDETHPVGQKTPNAWGLYDMHGNVWEWTASIRRNYYNRIYCGGSFNNYDHSCDVDYWYRSYQSYCSNNLGLRLAASRTEK